jgi:hypothetical protein
MRRWGLAITAFYAAVVLLLLLPLCFLLLSRDLPKDTGIVLQAFLSLGLVRIYIESWGILIYAGILVMGQALLLFLSVDTSWRHAKPRQHVAVTALLTSFFTAVLTWSTLASIEVAVYGQNQPPPLWKDKGELFAWTVLGIFVAFWVIWAGIFYRYCRNPSDAMSRIVGWLLRGSVLELLIAVPCHVIVRQRGDCSAPAVTSFGIVTGLAIMLLCFGPGVLALYRKKLDSYAVGRRNAQES